MNKKTILLLAFVLFPAIVTIITELNKTVLIWYIRMVDFIDLILIAPFYAVSFYLILRSIKSEFVLNTKLDKTTDFLSFFFVFLFFEGHGIHLAANAVNTYSTEIQNYLSIIPADSYSLLYFLDEILGHVIMFVGLYGVLIMIIIKELNVKEIVLFHVKWEDILLYVLGLLYGGSLAIVAIEATYFAISVMVLSFLVITGSVFYMYRKKIVWKNLFYTKFLLVTFISIILISIIYVIIFGEFVSPSTLY